MEMVKEINIRCPKCDEVTKYERANGIFYSKLFGIMICCFSLGYILGFLN